MWLLLLVLGCGGSEGARAPLVKPFVDAPDLSAWAQKAEIEVHNNTTAELRFEVTYGLHQPFMVAPLEAQLGLVSLDGKKHMCDCQCGKGRCVECEEPRVELKTLKPGDRWTYAWDGKLRSQRRDDDGEWCFDAFAAPAGPYLFKLSQGTAVGRTKVVLPVEEPIKIQMNEEQKKPINCPLDKGLLSRVARASLERLRRIKDMDQRLTTCRVDDVVCVGGLGGEEEKRRDSACSVFAVPGDELEVQVYLPLPPGTVGGDTFSHFFDVDGVRIQRVVYTQ